MKQRQASLACQLATEAAREDLACERAWQFLGYAQYAGGWHTPFEIQQLKAGNVWHERFGWLPRAHVERDEQGERLFRGRWLSDREEARQRGDIQNGWRIETEHYVVTSDSGLEETVALGRQLERLQAIWQQVFTGYLVDEAVLPGRLAGGEPLTAAAAAKHSVVYFRNRQEYNDALRATQPQIEATLGIYFADQRKAYFFAGLDQEPGTLYHEATHQLFAESRPIVKDLAERANFWIVEGAACYMESLVELDGYCTLGGPDAGRMPAARHRRLRDGFYVPLAQLAGLSMHDLQSRDDMARLYTESAGLATFLVDRYPQMLGDYLRAVYAGSADSASLARLTGVSDGQLDRLYGEYLEALQRRRSVLRRTPFARSPLSDCRGSAALGVARRNLWFLRFMLEKPPENGAVPRNRNHRPLADEFAAATHPPTQFAGHRLLSHRRFAGDRGRFGGGLALSPRTAEVPTALAGATAVILYFVLAEARGTYRNWRGISKNRELASAVGTWAGTLPGVVAGHWIAECFGHAPQSWTIAVLIEWFLLSAPLITALRLGARVIQRILRARGIRIRGFAIVGVNELGFQLAREHRGLARDGPPAGRFLRRSPEQRSPTSPPNWASRWERPGPGRAGPGRGDRPHLHHLPDAGGRPHPRRAGRPGRHDRLGLHRARLLRLPIAPFALDRHPAACRW